MYRDVYRGCQYRGLKSTAVAVAEAMSLFEGDLKSLIDLFPKGTSQRPVPIHPILTEALLLWKRSARYTQPNDWVFASKRYRGRRPIWGQAILRKYIRPMAQRLGIEKQFGWHTFRHTYSTLLRSVGTEFKFMQELLRHSTLRSTLDVYTQAVTPAKHAAQAAVVSLVFSSSAGGGSRIAGQEATAS